VSNGILDFVGNFIAFQMRLAEYLGFNGADYFITASSRLKQRLLSRKKRIKNEDIEVILNGTDLETYKPQETRHSSVQNKGFVATYAGSFTRAQGIECLIRAAEILVDEDVQFKLIGFRKSDSSLKKEIRRRLGEKAILIDWLPMKRLLVELQRSDVFILPADGSDRKLVENRIVTYATKLAEFLAIAKPLIVTKLDEGAELVEKYDCGFVCEPNAESIAKAIRKARGTSREVLITKGLNGRQCVEAELDMNPICKKYIRFLRSILEERGLQ
jgi:glycosyltransferase involved in cell wall biosynthesis